jgi:CheY-like chemotaxis protein
MSSNAAFSILLIEDDDVAAEAVVRGLRKHSFEFPIVVAEDGREALDILRGTHATEHIEKPYLALLDLNMPRMSGTEFLQQLRIDPQLHATVVFVLTTSGAETDRARAYRHTIAGYIVKSAVGPQCSKLARFLTEYQATVLLPS